MRTAIYYPHTTPATKDVLRTALLLWDELKFIVPWSGFDPPHADRAVAEAVEVIGRLAVPTGAQKREAHRRIQEFANGPLPAALAYRPLDHALSSHFMFGEKLLPDTWAMLGSRGLVGGFGSHRDQPLEDPTGLALMSILADCVAGEEKSRVTDRQIAYAQLSSLFVSKAEPTLPFDGPDRLVPVTLEIVDAGSLPLERMVAFRQREAATGGDALRRLRGRYRDRLGEQASLLAGATRNCDVEELRHQFRIDMRDDLADLRAELKLARTEAVTSKETVVLALASVGAAYAALEGFDFPLNQVAMAGSIPVLGGIINTSSKYAAAKRKIIAAHPMAYMLELGASVR